MPYKIVILNGVAKQPPFSLVFYVKNQVLADLMKN